MKTRITASAISKHMICSGYRYLDRMPSNNDKAARGTAIHAMIEDYLKNGNLPGENEREFYSWLEWWNRFSTHVVAIEAIEQAYSMDMFTETCQKLNVSGREYPYENGIIYGTADLVVNLNDGSKCVIDWKTGRKNTHYYDQISLLAAMSGADKAMLVYISADGVECSEMEQEDIKIHMDIIRAEVFANDEISFKLNEFCTDCDAIGCPFARTASLIADNTPNIMNERDLMTALIAKKELEKKLEVIDNNAKKFCSDNGGRVDLPDGSTYLMSIEKRKSYSTKLMAERLKSIGDDIEQYATETEFKKFTIKKNK